MKMKKSVKILLCVILAAVACLTFASCDGDTPTFDNRTTPAANVTTATPGTSSSDGPVVAGDGFSLNYNGVKLVPHAKLAPIIAALGDPVNYEESRSCSFVGLDKVYTYENLIIYSYPVDDVDYLYMITVIDDITTTDEGLKIGMDASEVTRLYGTDYEDKLGTYFFTKGNTQLSVKISGNTVMGITYIAVWDDNATP